METKGSNILIAGGSGLIGSHLSSMLIDKGYTVGHLTRGSTIIGDHINQFNWDVDNGEIDDTAILWADHIINLAGENVGQRWKDDTRDKILISRVAATQLLVDALVKNNKRVSSFINASAIGIYGEDTGEESLNENSLRGDGFLASVAKCWERAAGGVKDYAERFVVLRIGVVLTPAGGALEKMLQPIRWGVGSALGSGKQWISWIHINDLCRMFLMTIEEPIRGVLNGVAPNPVTNLEFTRELAKKMKKPLLMPRVPAFILKLLLGKMAIMVLGSNKVSPEAFQEEGFKFEYETLSKALDSLIDS
ncbi:MAG: TIGR01777 family oxidoreductase [Bacteroidota bacterium]